MFKIFNKRRIDKYISEVSKYLNRVFVPEKQNTIRNPSKSANSNSPELLVTSSDNDIKHSYLTDDEEELARTVQYQIKYSSRNSPEHSNTNNDNYNSNKVSYLMKKYNATTDTDKFIKDFDKILNRTFVDTLINHIDTKGFKDSQVYKIARIDRRLFSKIISDKQYKPAKDTVIAFAIALQLTLDETGDLLARAGYTLSHSNKKDIIIEYFIQKRIYSLDDLNQVLYNLGQKSIGR